MTTKLFDLEGKVALVSGASRGIGEEIARLLAEQGAHLIVSSRKAEDCQRVAAAIREAGGSASVLACNIGRMEDIAAAFEQIETLHGRLDILINNAAANPYFGHVLETDLAAFNKVELVCRPSFPEQHVASIELNHLRALRQNGQVLRLHPDEDVVLGDGFV